MRHNRLTKMTVALAALCAIAPATASAGSLLSGYGGPGQGNQEILGSALVNGPAGPAGGGSGEGGAGASASGPSAAAAGEAAARSGAPASAAHDLGGARAAQRSSHGAARAHGSSTGAAVSSSSRAAVVHASADHGPTLGLTASDVLYLLLALAALALTGFLTRRMVRGAEVGPRAG